MLRRPSLASRSAMAHAYTEPAAIAVAGTGSGTFTSTLLEDPRRPSCPESLFPQHQTDVSAATAHVCWPPAAIATSFGAPITWTGAPLLSVVPSPSCPDVLRPQHHAVWSSRITQVCSSPAVSAPTQVDGSGSQRLPALHTWPSGQAPSGSHGPPRSGTGNWHALSTTQTRPKRIRTSLRERWRRPTPPEPR